MQFRAYLFDVQGTLFDFFTPVCAAVARYLNGTAVTDVDAAAFTRHWRENYFQRVGGIPLEGRFWQPVQGEYEAGFADVCARYGLPEPDSSTARTVADSWQRLEPWPDVRDGMALLRSQAIAATLSNADMSTVISLFKCHDVGMDAIFTAELFGAFKPDPRAYQGALRYLGLRAAEVAMVASHPYDLAAAAAQGLGTVFVHRPLEYGDPDLGHRMAAASVSQYVEAIDEIR